MPKKMSLPFKGEFPHSQGFGARPEVYAKFGIAGHDGDDWTMNEHTPIYSPFTGKVIKSGDDPSSYGLFLWIWDPTQKLKVNIAHLSVKNVNEGDDVVAGQWIGLSGNTGFSEAPHVHVAAADTDDAGHRINVTNGFNGWYSVLDTGKIELVPLSSVGVVGQATSTPTPTQTKVGPEGIVAGDYPPTSLTQAQRQWLWEHFGNAGIAPDGYGGQSTGDVPGKAPAGLPVGPGGIKPGDYQADQLTQDQRNFLWHFFGNSGDAPAGFGGYRYFGQTGPWPDNAKYGPGGLPPGSYDPTSLTQEQRQWLFEYFGNSGQASVGYGGQWISEIRPGGPARPIETPPPLPAPPLQPVTAEMIESILPTTQTPSSPPVIMEPTIFVTSDPINAKFYIDGLYFPDRTPANKPYPVAVGSHEVVVEKAGYEKYTEVVNISDGEQKIVHAKLTVSPVGTPTTVTTIPAVTPPTLTTKQLLVQIDAKVDQILQTLTKT